MKEYSLDEFPEKLDADRPMVRFAKVTKRYGDLVVLDELDLDVAEGEIISIIGPSGSGKTTVLRMLMTLETIDATSAWSSSTSICSRT